MIGENIQIEVKNISKKYNKQLIFKDISYTFRAKSSYALLGHNGSGKSTLLQALAGYIGVWEGSIEYLHSEGKIEPANWYKYLSWSAPYTELLREYSLDEMIRFHFSMQPRPTGWSVDEVKQLLGLEKYGNRPLKYFSSGMEQRVKVGLAILTPKPILLLDEPCTNFDKQAVSWYQQLMATYASDKVVIIASNSPEEYSHTQYQIQLTSYAKHTS